MTIMIMEKKEFFEQREVKLEKHRQKYKGRKANKTTEVINERLAKLREMQKVSPLTKEKSHC